MLTANPSPTSPLYTTITSALRIASGKFTYGARFSVKALGVGYRVDCTESDAKGPIDAARACLRDAGLDVWELGYGSLHVQAAQPLPCFDEEDDEDAIRAELALEAASHAPEYDREVELETRRGWVL